MWVLNQASKSFHGSIYSVRMRTAGTPHHIMWFHKSEGALVFV